MGLSYQKSEERKSEENRNDVDGGEKTNLRRKKWEKCDRLEKWSV